MNGALPAGYAALSVRSASIVAAQPLAEWVSRTVQEHGSLYRFAQTAPGKFAVRGRDLAYVVPLTPAAPGLGIVRWLRHGGLLGAITSDRFFALGRPRPANELLASARLRERGVGTPQVLAACVYHGPGFYRGEVLRAYHAEWTDLAAYLFTSQPPTDLGRRALHEAARLAAQISECGLCHTDFNARNLLVREEPDFGVMVIDLEKAAACTPGSEEARRRMLKRLRQSLLKLASRSSRPRPADWLEPLAPGTAHG